MTRSILITFACATLLLSCVSDVLGVHITLDYSLDDQNERWFNPETQAGAERRAIVESAASFLSDIIEDEDWSPLTSYDGRFSVQRVEATTLRGFDGQLVAGTPDPGGTGFAYVFDTTDIRPVLAANEVVIHMLGIDYATATVSSASSFIETLRTTAAENGEEFTPWGGRIQFNSTLSADAGADWYSGNDPGEDPRDNYGWQRADKTPPGEFVDDNWRYSTGESTWLGYDTRLIDVSANSRLDLYQQALSQIITVLGFSFDEIPNFIGLNGSGQLVGENAVAEFGGPVPFDGGSGVAQGVESTVYGSAGIVSEALLVDTSRLNFRRYLTDLDAALLRDLGYIVADPPPFQGQLVSGDYDRDAAVDGSDFLLWQRQLGQSVPVAFASADGSGDLQITAKDLQIWEDYFGTVVPGGTLGVNFAVPEPSTVTLLTGVLLAATCFCRAPKHCTIL